MKVSSQLVGVQRLVSRSVDGKSKAGRHNLHAVWTRPVLSGVPGGGTCRGAGRLSQTHPDPHKVRRSAAK
eukprot:179265-Rhodomonas_salina.4